MDKNNRIYIAGRMTGDPDYKVKFKSAEAMLVKAQRNCNKSKKPCSGCPFYDRNYITLCRIADILPQQLEVMNPAEFGFKDKPYWFALLRCLIRLSRCQYVFFLNDWEQSRGARREHWLAIKLKKHIIYQNTL